MTFVQNLSKINKLVFLFGISPYSFNRKSNKFECSVLTLIYSLVYFLFIATTITYMAVVYYVQGGQMLQSTYTILTLLQQATIMFIFYSVMLDVILKRQKHANFLNSLVELDSNLSKFYTIDNSCDNDLRTLHMLNLFVVCFNVVVYASNSIFNWNQMQVFAHIWNVMQLFQTISLTLIGYYVRCLAIVLYHRCAPIFRSLDSIGKELRYNNNDRECISGLMKCFEAFDEVMNLKTELSAIFGIQLLLNSAFDFLILTISVYGLLYFQAKDLTVLYYFTVYNLPHGIKCVLLVLALDTLANQINTLRKCTVKISVDPNKKLSGLMDLIFLKINHMEKDKYVTASDFYPVNRSMLYGMGAAIVTHMMIIFQFQQWEDNQPKPK